MKLETIDIPLILPQPMSGTSSNYDEEEKGFFAKLFKKKPEKPFYETRIEEFGYDELYRELSDSPAIYQVRNTNYDKAVILTENYFILPGQEILPFERIAKYVICNLGEMPWEQYAEDRGLDTPYDPNYTSEYEGEEDFELERFKIKLAIVDIYGLQYQYDFYMEASDRHDFHDELSDRCDGVDFTRNTVLEGKFSDNDDYWFTLMNER